VTNAGRNLSTNGRNLPAGVALSCGGWRIIIDALAVAPFAMSRRYGADLMRFSSPGKLAADPGHSPGINPKLRSLGALIGLAFEWILKGKPTAAGRTAAQGTPGVDDRAGRHS
jgi:aquaporin Z